MLAKTIKEADGTAILISPWAFTQGFDTQIRVHCYVHELTHVEQDAIPPKSETPAVAEEIYSENLRILYGEYEAERHALEACADLFDTPSDPYVELHRSVCASFVAALSDDDARQALIRAVARFRFSSIDITGFQAEVRPVFDRISKSLVYAAAYIDSGSGFCEDIPAYASARFMTDSARELLSHFATVYDDGNHDLVNGIALTKAFAQTFGFIYEDTDEGLYCRVVGLSI